MATGCPSVLRWIEVLSSPSSIRAVTTMIVVPNGRRRLSWRRRPLMEKGEMYEAIASASRTRCSCSGSRFGSKRMGRSELNRLLLAMSPTAARRGPRAAAAEAGTRSREQAKEVGAGELNGAEAVIAALAALQTEAIADPLVPGYRS